jgi:hypothetical protein
MPNTNSFHPLGYFHYLLVAGDQVDVIHHKREGIGLASAGKLKGQLVIHSARRNLEDAVAVSVPSLGVLEGIKGLNLVKTEDDLDCALVVRETLAAGDEIGVAEVVSTTNIEVADVLAEKTSVRSDESDTVGADGVGSGTKLLIVDSSSASSEGPLSFDALKVTVLDVVTSTEAVGASRLSAGNEGFGSL